MIRDTVESPVIAEASLGLTRDKIAETPLARGSHPVRHQEQRHRIS